MVTEFPTRQISSELIDHAEAVRTAGKFAEALALTRQALQTDIQPLTAEEITELSQDGEQATLLAVGARLIGESSKSLMKRSYFPWQMRERARVWLQEAGPLYGNQDLRNAAEELEWDHHGRYYYFDREFARDIADYLATLSFLYADYKADKLIDSADQIWNLLLQSLEENDDDEHFFILERNWFLFKTGRAKQISLDDVEVALKGYYSRFGGDNADRLKALATRAFVMAEAADHKGIIDFAVEKLEQINQTKSVPQEFRKLFKEKYRNLAFKVWAIFTGKSQKSLQIYGGAHSLGSYQQQRLIHARK